MAFGDPIQFPSVDSGSVANANLAFVSNNTSGNILGMMCRIGSGTITVSTLTDSRNTWTFAKRQLDSSSVDTGELWYTLNCGAGANTVSITLTGTATLRWGLGEWTGNGASAAFDSPAVSASAGSTNMDSGPKTTAQNNTLLIGGNFHANDFGASITAAGSFTERWQVASRSQLQDRVVSATGTYNSLATLSVSEAWGALMMAINDGGGGGGEPSTVVPQGYRMLSWAWSE
jgi:hypothetical protein